MKSVVLMVTFAVLLFSWGVIVGWVYRGLKKDE